MKKKKTSGAKKLKHAKPKKQAKVVHKNTRAKKKVKEQKSLQVKHETYDETKKYPALITRPRIQLNLNPQINLAKNLFEKPDEKAMRDGFGEALLEEGKKDKDVVVLTADLTESTRVNLFGKEFPKRMFNVGIAEQNMLAMSAGLALSGKKPFAASFAIFSIGRAWDQLRTSICYSNANVKVIGTHAGVTVGIDGATHQMLSDIALTTNLPNLTVISPCDYEQAKLAVAAASKIKGPVYLRIGRAPLPVATTKETPFEVGRADFYCEGKDVVIIATGELVYEALLAAKKLESSGISAGVMNMHTLKPLDESAVIKAAMMAPLIITAEDHYKTGGLGSLVAQVLSQSDLKKKPKQMVVGVDDVFGMSGEPKELMKEFKITAQDIYEAAIRETRL